MDFKAKPNKEFDFNWNWSSEEIRVKSTIQEDYFVVEGAITITSLKAVGLLQGDRIQAGVYRAKYHLQQDGSYKPTWITWVNPETETPNFHIASSFGV